MIVKLSRGPFVYRFVFSFYNKVCYKMHAIVCESKYSHLVWLDDYQGIKFTKKTKQTGRAGITKRTLRPTICPSVRQAAGSVALQAGKESMIFTQRKEITIDYCFVLKSHMENTGLKRWLRG